MAKVVIAVKQNPNEKSASVLRRFSRKIKESNILRQVKLGSRNIRKESQFKKKKNALKKIERRKEIEKLKKMGKMK